MPRFLAALAALFVFATAAHAADRIVLPSGVVPERYDVEVVPDANALTFTGHVAIAIDVQAPTLRIVLNAADLKFGRVALSGRTESPRIELDSDRQTAAFVFTTPIAPGRHRLSIAYSGRIYRQASGLFALDYDTPRGQRRALYTQFENSDARRFVPGWDEPGIKAVFALTVVAPKGQMAVSNMPVADTAPRPGGRQAVRFRDSPRMSSYLVFLALGDFERISRQVEGVDVGVVVRRGETAKAAFALDAAAKLLGYYNAYFATPYPLPKLDLVAAPGQSQFFSAMENWGAIFYFDYALLLDPRTSTEADRQNAFVVVAHEMAHQWFGDLVTMAWWDDLWLNEGFASWMENKATDHFHPEWKVWLQTAQGQQYAMALDARTGAHPVITPIPDVLAASNAFDSITYQKGQAVIRMLEAYMGEDAFRDGVRRYVARHAYGATVTADLWAALDEGAVRPVAQIADDFTRQTGVPLIRAEAADGALRLTQSRFVAEGEAAPRAWRTPVVVQAPAAAPVPMMVTGERGEPSLPFVPGTVVNAGQTGYFRTAYAPALWAPLLERFPTLAAADQLGLIYDSRALGEAGVVPVADLLQLLRRVGPDADPVVLAALADQLAALDRYYDGSPGQPAFRAYALARLRPIQAGLGWTARVGEADNLAGARAAVLKAMGAFGEPAVLAEARRRFAAYRVRPAGLTGTERETVLAIVAGRADATTWRLLHAMAVASRDPTDKSRLYRLLGAAHDPALAGRALALALSGEPPATSPPALIRAVSHVYPDQAFGFALAHRAQLEESLEPAARPSFLTELAAPSRRPETADRLDALARSMPASGRGEADKSASAIRFRAEVIDKRLPDIDRWLSVNPEPVDLISPKIKPLPAKL